jgi:hypothetical protein
MFEFQDIDFDNANCKDHPTEWWFPEFPPTRQKTKQWKQAKAICAECSIKDECLAFGKATHSYGIWGGITLTRGIADYRKRKQK